MSEKITELIKQVEALVCYSQIYTVKGVQPVNMPDHETAWRKAQQWLWDNCEADDYGNYHLKEVNPGLPPLPEPILTDEDVKDWEGEKRQTGAVWVKATERLPTPGKITWRWLDRAEAYSGYDEKRGFIYGTGGASVDPTYHTEIEWLDEQPVEQTSQDAHEKEVMMQAFDKVRQIFEGRQWIMDGRGSYPYNDDRYKEEVRHMYDEFDKVFKETWGNIQSKSVDYRKAIIAQYVNYRMEGAAADGTAAGREDAILFSEWCASNYQRDFEPLDSTVPIGKRKYRQFWIDNDQREFTTTHLYEQFKQQKEK